MIEIRNRYTGEVLLRSEADTLREANLSGADLWGADLREADLREADLREADLREADLREADLREANLSGADLRRVNLRWANLSGANLRRANLRGADLRGADLSGADLRGANLRYAVGNSRAIRSLQCDTWPVVVADGMMAIGCQQHPLSTWWQFTDAQIAVMDRLALEWWRRWKPILRQMFGEADDAS